MHKKYVPFSKIDQNVLIKSSLGWWLFVCEQNIRRWVILDDGLFSGANSGEKCVSWKVLASNDGEGIISQIDLWASLAAIPRTCILYKITIRYLEKYSITLQKLSESLDQKQHCTKELFWYSNLWKTRFS